MKHSKKMILLVLVFCVVGFFAGDALAREVLYAPFEDYIDNTMPPQTTVWVGEVLQTWKCDFYNGTPPISGKVGNAFEFDGTMYIQVPSNDPTLDFGYDDFAITFWVKTTINKFNNTISDKRDFSGIGYHVAIYQGRPLLQLHDTNYGMYNYWASSSSAVTDGQWHHIAIYVDRDDHAGGKMYVDGLCVLTFDPTRHTGSLTNSADLLIGGHKNFSGYNFEGTLDELRHFRFIPK